MLINAKQLQRYWGVNPEYVLHVGGHRAEELDTYQKLGWGNKGITWVEALPDAAQVIRDRVKPFMNHSVLEMLAWDTTNEMMTFYETSNGQSSSALALKMHKEEYPDIEVVRTFTFQTKRLDEVISIPDSSKSNLINLDVQGAELKVLRGLGALLNSFDAIYAEVNIKELYSGGAFLHELDEFLTNSGYTRVDVCLTKAGWGDALWLRANSSILNAAQLRRLGRQADSLVHCKARVRSYLARLMYRFR